MCPKPSSLLLDIYTAVNLYLSKCSYHTVALLVDVDLWSHPCTHSSVNVWDICPLFCLRAGHFDQTICEGMQMPEFRKLKQRQSRKRRPPETLLLYLVLISGLNPCEPDVLEASVSAVPRVDVFEPKCNPEPSWLLVEVSPCWSATNLHSEPPQPPVLRLQFSCLVLIRF